MFDNDVRPESVPKRVFEFCRIVSQEEISIDDIRNKIFPEDLNVGINNSYFNYIMGAAEELKLIEKTESKSLIYVGDKNHVKNLHSFRRYCNSVVWKNENTRFYKIAHAFLDSELDWISKGSFSQSPEILGLVRKSMNDADSDLQRHILGERFWLSFLGFGYIYSSNNVYNFLPNMYIALKDFIVLSDIEKNKEITMNDFVTVIYKNFTIGLKDAFSSKSFNYAFSSALRQLHDNKEIVLKRISDSKEIWNLYPMGTHEFVKEITHITIREGINK